MSSNSIYKAFKDGVNNFLSTVDKQLPNIKFIYVVILILIFVYISFSYMLKVFDVNLFPDTLKPLAKFIFTSTIALNVINAIIKNHGKKKGGSSLSKSDDVERSQVGGGVKSMIDSYNNKSKIFSQYKTNFLNNHGNFKQCAYISNFIDTTSRGIFTMSIVYIITATCLSFVDIIIASDIQGGTCTSVGNLSNFINTLTSDPYRTIIFYFILFTLILILLGYVNFYYLGPTVGKIFTLLPKFRDLIIKYIFVVIKPIFIAVIGIFIFKQLLTDNIVRFLNHGSITTIDDNLLNKIMSIIIFAISLVLVIVAIKGRKLIKFVFNSGTTVYENIFKPIFGPEGWLKEQNHLSTWRSQ